MVSVCRRLKDQLHFIRVYTGRAQYWGDEEHSNAVFLITGSSPWMSFFNILKAQPYKLLYPIERNRIHEQGAAFTNARQVGEI